MEKIRQNITAFLLIAFSLISCSSGLVNTNQIRKFTITVEKPNETRTRTVKLNGENIDSAIWIKEYNILYRQDKVYVKIIKTIRNSGITGPYSLQFIISDSVKEILLGNETIWINSD